MPFRAGAGWVIAETLCCLVIVSVLAALITESSGMMARFTVSGLEKRTRSLDFRSIVLETENTGAYCRILRGAWQANTGEYASESGISRMEVSVSSGRDEATDTVRWIMWDISGRSK